MSTGTANVAVGYITEDRMHADFVAKLLDLVAQRQDEIKGRVIQVTGFAGRLDIGRTVVVRGFLERTDADYLLMVDSDSLFGVADYDQLLEDQERLTTEAPPAVISGVYARSDGSMCVFDYDDTGYHPVTPGQLAAGRWYEPDAFGLGFCMVSRAALEQIREDQPEDELLPWFNSTIEGPGKMADDTSFCYRAQEAGVSLYVDTKVQIGHLKTVAMFPKIESSLEVPKLEVARRA